MRQREEGGATQKNRFFREKREELSSLWREGLYSSADCSKID